MSDAIIDATDALAVAFGRASSPWPGLRGFSFDEMTALQGFWDAALAEAAQTLRDAIAELDLDDHWSTMYQAGQVQRLPDLIDPAKCSRCMEDDHEEECGDGA